MRVVVPVKRFELAKQRLSPAVSVEQRMSLMRDMAETVLRELAASTSHDGVLVVSGEESLRPLAAQLSFDYLDDPGGGLNAAIAAAIARAMRDDCKDIAIVHADLPLFTAREFDRLAAAHLAGPKRKMTIVQDRWNDGTTIRFCRPADAVPPLYGPGSARRHRGFAIERGLAVEDSPSATLSVDCDTPEDLRHIASLKGAATVPAFSTATRRDGGRREGMRS
jgi:2-phospho-L-lactate guanylyltransferase